MKKCIFTDDCGFFNGGFREHSIGEFLLNDYCFGTPQFCAINVAFTYSGEAEVLHDLLPSELSRVKHMHS
jgi:hypothetical protein